MFDSHLSVRSVIRGLVFLLLVIAIGTGWFVFMEGYTLLDGLYMTVITISTVGFREVVTLDGSGRLFTVFLIIAGLTVLTYTLGSLGRVIVEGSIERYVGRKRMLREIDKLRGHYIICGHGRMGQILCEELNKEKVPFVVVEGDPDEAENLTGKGYLVVRGDATEDTILREAGVLRAKGLVAVVSSNVDNLYITLSARVMCREENPGLFILSRATDRQACEKIERAGADRVVSPYVIGGMRIVQALLRPTVNDFLEIATRTSGLDLMFEELAIGSDSALDGVALKDSQIRASYDVVVIAIKKRTGEMVFNPGSEAVLHNGDMLVALGDRGQLDNLGKALA
jgi:voltage-gated potassium channel